MDFEALMLKKSKQALPLAEPINNPVRPLDPAAGADVPAMEVDQNHVDLVDVDRGIAPPWNHGDLLLIVKDVELGQTLKIHKESHGLEPW